MALSKEDGRLGGSGNGRNKIDDMHPPPFFEEPYGGKGEAHQQALKRKATDEEEPGEITDKNPGGRPCKTRLLVQELVTSMGELNASASEAGNVLPLQFNSAPGLKSLPL